MVPTPEKAKWFPPKVMPALMKPLVPVMFTVPVVATFRPEPNPAVFAGAEAKVSAVVPPPGVTMRFPCPAVSVSAPTVSALAAPVMPM